MDDAKKFHLETHDSAVSTELGAAVDLELKNGQLGAPKVNAWKGLRILRRAAHRGLELLLPRCFNKHL